jgi:hypothetical protein
MPKQPITKRQRFTLRDKKNIIEKYIYFLQNIVVDLDDPELLWNPHDGMTEERHEKSITMFLRIENKSRPKGHELHIEMSNVFKWYKALQRGEFLEWGEINDLDQKNCRSQLIIKHIDCLLLNKHKNAGFWNQLVKSPSSSDKYGVIAREDIPAGTFLGYFQGEHFISQVNVKGLNIFKICENNYINASKEFSSCYGRYYNWSTTEANNHNVSVGRVSDWTDANESIYFTARVEIKKGVELIVSHKAGCRKANNNDSNKQTYKTIYSNFDMDT